MKSPLPFLLTLLLLASNVQSLTINEVMPRSPEWIEIYNQGNEWLNLSFFSIGDEQGNDTLTCKGIENCSLLTNETLFLIIGEKTNITQITNETVKYFRTNSGSIGKYGLRDSGETVRIFVNKTLVDETTYPSFKERENETWCRKGGEWTFCIPTPGFTNYYVKQETNETNETNGTCDLSLFITSPPILDSGKKNEYYIEVMDEECGGRGIRIEYWIEDLFGKEVRPEFNTSQNLTCYKKIARQWTPEDIDGSEAYYIKARLYAKCNDSNISNNYAEKLIVVRGKERPLNSSIWIREVQLGSEGEGKFGEIVKIELGVYKGDTSKNSIRVWIENRDGKKASRVAYAKFFSKLSNYTLVIPLQIDPNCNGELLDGKYLVRVEGLGKHDEKEILIKGISDYSCKTKIIETSKPCSCGPCPPRTEKTEEREFEVISSPEEIRKDEEMVMRIKIINSMDSEKNYTVYSYVYGENGLSSLGYDGKAWLKRWDANRQEVSLPPNSSLLITLKNRVANDTKPGRYKLRIRIRDGDKKHDITRDILVMESEKPPPEKNETESNQFEVDRYETRIEIPTGRVVSRERNWFSSFVESIIKFFKNLFAL